MTLTLTLVILLVCVVWFQEMNKTNEKNCEDTFKTAMAYRYWSDMQNNIKKKEKTINMAVYIIYRNFEFLARMFLLIIHIWNILIIILGFKHIFPELSK